MHPLLSQPGDELTDEPIKVGIGGGDDAQPLLAQVIDGLVVDHEGYIIMLEGRVRVQDGIIRFHHSRRHLCNGSILFNYSWEVRSYLIRNNCFT